MTTNDESKDSKPDIQTSPWRETNYKAPPFTDEQLKIIRKMIINAIAETLTRMGAHD